MSNFFKTLLGVAGAVSPFIPGLGWAAKAGIMGAGALLGSSDDQSQSNQAYGAQRGIADEQRQLYNQTSPYYTQLLGHLNNYANEAATPESYMGQPAQQMALNQANEGIGRQYQGSADQLSFGLGRRGLTGSSMDVAGRAALLANADQQRANFQRNLIMQQPQEYARRLGMLGGMLNPGLGAGQAAAGIYGQQGANYGNQASNLGNGIGQSLQSYMMYDALRKAQIGLPNPYAQPGSGATRGPAPYSPEFLNAIFNNIGG